ncbi:hypothetical protein BD309DRAFT_306694 [Dichomitus squalens]|uniref:NADH-ubiquinone oxidoreductase 9.5 kDa subunit n=2 Tax=Dichomitus squalens TaxID=114155 RepID=A0A4Q9NI87_9APHY|nr:uncharacterized protein DICSQDRAFT_170740 [Dichomitus squalens LYAD-421 SS1]EJF60880.1 hypothetical protein DICSQDRAFT_170740 [Dichomitus squalens LYAD-421 SS1]TBU26433.1 hypothetical protein BD311DRAFT_726105 [Dichomitus squalens]TBU40950.1 hypothetical protein BD309DRAFT_306694 [Dichomitus squalens]TBU53272.1 hypothetical protein BD310DRAFT_938428 [Dichomitus squalens]
MAAAWTRTYRYLQRQAHEQPVIFYSVIIGLIGPVMVVTVPPIRKSLGWKPAEPIPTSYPVPNRPRRAISGYDDE